ncbi:DUF748 domain-containing protein [Candidatus Pandoraea novymonadis]|uniref:DUF748 domain-containing protein n=1 Tax=Candidatus Pandoraea novymonadis TaxID=1808959 RepID=UPI0015E6FFF2|nr:DUF748 domain-containing protein [Candidatus Pandoraea novymonadis]
MRRTPILNELYIDTPVIHIVRRTEQDLNFSDIFEKAISELPKLESSKASRISISNIQISNGSIFLNDQVRRKQDTVENINIGIPFITNLPSHTNIFVKPSIQATINGSTLNISGQSQLFSDSHESSIEIKINRLDISRYLGYSPASIPMVLKEGWLSTKLQLKFRRFRSTNEVMLAGTLVLDDIKLDDRLGNKLSKLKHLKITIDNLEPLRNICHVKAIHLDGLDQNILIDSDGSLAITRFNSQHNSVEKTPSDKASSFSTEKSKSMSGASKKIRLCLPSNIDFRFGDLTIIDSTIHITDKRFKKPAQLSLNHVHIHLKQFSMCDKIPASYDASFTLSSGGKISANGQLYFSEHYTTGSLEVNNIELISLLPFSKNSLIGRFKKGKIGLNTKFQIKFGSSSPNLIMSSGKAIFNQIEWITGNNGDEPIKFSKAEVKIIKFDLTKRKVSFENLRINDLKIKFKRNKNGHINLITLKNGRRGKNVDDPLLSARKTKKRNTTKISNKNWQWQVNRITLENARISLEDQAVKGEPIQANLTPLNITLNGMSQKMNQSITVEAKGALNKKGSINVIGSVTPKPLSGELKIRTNEFDLALFDSYLSKKLNVSIISALLNSNGVANFAVKGKSIEANYRGNASLNRVRLLDKMRSGETIRWNSLAMQKISISVGSDTPQVNIDEITVSTLYTQLIINANGQLNLTDAISSKNEVPKLIMANASKSTLLNLKANIQSDINKETNRRIVNSKTSDARTFLQEVNNHTTQITKKPNNNNSYYGAGKALSAHITVGKTIVKNGNVKFTDKFIQPHYTANLTNIDGCIGTFSSTTATPVNVFLQGQLNQNGSLNIAGRMDPFTAMPFIDLDIKASGIELKNLTPYTIKYTGYPIETGKLTLNAHYLIDQGRLTANNHIYIVQLVFGKRIENSMARNLPLRLIASLLKNKKEEINIEMPVYGSIQDPQLNFGNVIFRSFVNLIVKAAATPFGLLVSMFEDIDKELNSVIFEPGHSILTPDQEKKLETLIKVLEDHPILRLEIVGCVDPAKDVKGLQQVILDRLIKVQKAKSSVKHNENSDLTSIIIESNERDKFIREAYKAENFPKTKNIISFLKEFSSEKIEELMITGIKITDDDLECLAHHRAKAVQAWLNRKIDSDRLSIVTKKLKTHNLNKKDIVNGVCFILK